MCRVLVETLKDRNDILFDAVISVDYVTVRNSALLGEGCNLVCESYHRRIRITV